MTLNSGGSETDPADDLTRWMTQYGPLLKRYFRRRVTAAEAEDLVQDVFLAMHARGGDAPIENVQGYLFTIASRLLARRKSASTVAIFDDDAAFTDDFSPERLFISHQEFVLTIAAIRNLPPRARNAFVLHRFENMSYAAIARMLNISVSAVGKLIARALAQITRELESRR